MFLILWSLHLNFDNGCDQILIGDYITLVHNLVTIIFGTSKNMKIS